MQGLKASSMIYGSTTPLQSVGQLSDMGYHLVFRPLSGMQLYSNLPTTAQTGGKPVALQAWKVMSVCGTHFTLQDIDMASVASVSELFTMCLCANVVRKQLC